MVVELGKEYNTALLAVERNNHGSGGAGECGNWDIGEVYVQNGQEGWLTSAVSRPAMIENLASALMMGAGVFRSSRLLNECRTFVRVRTGAGGGSGNS